MEAKEKEILNELISGTKCQFVIPVFQRNYDWRIKDCARLFDDIVDLAKDKDHPDRKHFMGAFVCKFTRFVDTSFNQYVLIDGQQRLTSIILILKALYDYLGSFGEKYKEVRSEIKETYLINKFARESNLKLKLKPNKVDNDNFNKLMEDEKIDSDSTIGRNYLEFFKMIQSMDVPFEDFYNALQRLEGVVVFLDDTDNPQVIFESLNSTGLELTDVDLIRNYLLMNCKANEQEELYKNYWLKIEQLLGNNFLQFVRDYLSLKNGIVTPGKKNATYTCFQKYYSSNKFTKKEFLENFYKMAQVYNQLINPSFESKNLKNALMDYISLEITTTYPFVLGLLIDNTTILPSGKKLLNDEFLASILRLLEAYLIRRNVCNLAGGGLSQVMASLYNDIKKKHGDNFYKDPVIKVASALAGISTKAYFPKDEEFLREITNRDMYHNRNIDYILRKIELYTQGKEIINFSKLSIEHIMPQTLSNEWIKYLGRKEDYKEFHEEYVHKLGNLTLTAYNPEMSNKLYAEKKEHIDFSRLTLNRYFENIDEWKTEEQINARSKYLADIALKIWPYPKTTSIEDIATESHFLLDDEAYDYTGTTPAGLLIKDKKIIEYTWINLFISALKYLYEINSNLLEAILNKKDLFSCEKPLISHIESELRMPMKLTNDVFIETNTSTERKIKILKIIFQSMQFDDDEIIVYIK